MPTHHPLRQAGADKVLIQCLQSVHLEDHLGVHHGNLHHLYIPRPPTTPSTQAGADRVLIQCLQSVHLEVHLDVTNENLQYNTLPPISTPWTLKYILRPLLEAQEAKMSANGFKIRLTSPNNIAPFISNNSRTICRVVINEWHNVLHYSDPNLNLGDILCIWGCHNIWSIW